MQFKFKAVGAAVALVLATGAAHANGLTLPGVSTGSDLVINIWDNDANNAGFTQDLGVNLTSFNPANSFSLTLTNPGAIAAFNQNVTGTLWDITAGKGTGNASTAGTYLISSQTQTTAGDTASQIDGAISGLASQYGFLKTKSGNTFASSTTGSVVTTSADSEWAASTAQGSGNLSEIDTQFASDGTSTSSVLYFDQLTTDGSTASGSVLSGFWTLTFDALTATTATLTWTPTSTVPLPAAVWLLGSGLLGLAGIGRRRFGIGNAAAANA
ncbi:MAG TPA: VPLPA-CTERM sorting domain-containing protein [Steroidobacteraceae bacterium]|nr:VPLPA-CTERM sorting domain-containing protein [Steroidobacteraceae bacterium]